MALPNLSGLNFSNERGATGLSLQPRLRECSTGVNGDTPDRTAVKLTFMEDNPRRVLIFITTYFAVDAYDENVWQARGGLVAENDQEVIDCIRQYLVEEDVAVLERQPSGVDNFYRAKDNLSKDALAEKSKPDLVQLAKNFGATAYLTANDKTTTFTFLRNADHVMPS